MPGFVPADLVKVLPPDKIRQAREVWEKCPSGYSKLRQVSQ